MPTPISWPLAPIPVTTPDSPASGVRGQLQAVPDFGLDVSTYPDLDATFAQLSGVACLAQHVARYLEDSRRGLDLRQWLNDDFDAARQYQLQAAVEELLLADERVTSVDVSVASTLYALTLTIHLVATTAGPFRLVLQVTDLSVALLSVES
jgi:hypothetical protein